MLRLLGVAALVAVLCVAVVPSVDLDPTALRAWRSALILLWLLAVTPQLVVAIVLAVFRIDATEHTVPPHVTELVELTATRLC
jgi:hypothetical protein